MFLMRVYAMCMACFWFVVEKETSSSRRFYYSFHYSLFYYHILLLSSMCRWHFSAMVCRRYPRVGNMIIELVSSFPPNKQKTHFACFPHCFCFISEQCAGKMFECFRFLKFKCCYIANPSFISVRKQNKKQKDKNADLST